jgi:hypothetical protein
MRGRLAIALVLGALAGCYNPALQDCAVTCTNNACPSGFDCVAGVCRSTTGACPGSGSADAPDLSGFVFRKRVAITAVPNSVSTDFPLSIRRTADPDLANFAQSTGADILFATVDGMVLPSEIERFDKTTGELVAWVNVPAFASTTSLYMYFGSETAQGPTSTAVWDADFIGVWHLSDPPGMSVADSTINAIAAQKAVSTGPSPTLAGKLAGGQVFTGASTEYLSIGSSAAVVPSELTFETWINYTMDDSDSYRAIFASPGTQHPTLVYPNAGTAAVIPTETLIVELGGAGYFSPAGAFKQGVWNHVVFSTGGSLASTALYINGAAVALSSAGQSFPSGSAVTFGSLGPPQGSVSGTMDEIRYSKTLRSGAYVASSYAFESQDTLVTFGAVETVR